MNKRSGTIFGMVVTLILTVSAIGLAHDNRDRDGYSHRNSLDARQEGYKNGYRDGAYHGRVDRERRIGYKFQGGNYKKGDHGYEKYMGNKGDYKNAYRQGYQAGYDNGYNGRNRGRFGNIYDSRDDRNGRWYPDR